MGSRQRLVAASGAVLGGVALVAAVAAQGALAAGAAPVRAGGRPSAAPETRAIGGRRTVPGASGATLALLTAKLSSYSASVKGKSGGIGRPRSMRISRITRVKMRSRTMSRKRALRTPPLRPANRKIRIQAGSSTVRA